jgi:hypothetical protein
LALEASLISYKIVHALVIAKRNYFHVLSWNVPDKMKMPPKSSRLLTGIA